jgi:hypothetical protein
MVVWKEFTALLALQLSTLISGAIKGVVKAALHVSGNLYGIKYFFNALDERRPEVKQNLDS